MKLYVLRTYQIILSAPVILCLIVLGIYALSLATGATGKNAHETGGILSEVKIAPESFHAARTNRLAQAYGLLPLSFEANRGQADPSVQFLARSAGYGVFLTRDEAVVAFQGQSQDHEVEALEKMSPAERKLFETRKMFRISPRFQRLRKTEFIRIMLQGANPRTAIEPLDMLPGKVNYFIGKDVRKWRTDIPTYARVKYRAIYPGIDLVYYGNQRQLEFDFVLAPGADGRVINLAVATKGRLRLNSNGNVEVQTKNGAFEMLRPRIFQMENGTEHPVEGGFMLLGKNQIGIQMARYDHDRPVVIDPALSYSSYLGGSGTDEADDIKVDAVGNAYVTGQTTSLNFPTKSGYSSTGNANGTAFVTKLDPTGKSILYSTYLGGRGSETLGGMAIDATGNVYITGSTTSSNFPIVHGYQIAIGTTNGNAFVARIDTTKTGTASLVYSTYLGGGGNSTNPAGDAGFGIAVDASGIAYITGQTTSDASTMPFPTTSSALQTTLGSKNGNAFLSVLDTNQAGTASLLYSSYLGGDGAGMFGDYGIDIAVGGAGIACVTGQTSSNAQMPFPITPGAYQSSLNGSDGNIFVTEMDTTQSGTRALLYSTYLGGSDSNPNHPGDEGDGIAFSADGTIYIAGGASSADFPTTAGAFQTSNSTAGKAIIAKLDPTQLGAKSLVYSTFLGGSGGEVGNAIALDSVGDAFVAGSTGSSDFPTTSGAFETARKSSYLDAFLTELNSAGTALVYSSYFGGSCAAGDLGFGISVDSNGNPYMAGLTCSTDLPVFDAYQTSLAGVQNGFFAKFALIPNPGITATASPVANASGWDSVKVTVSFTCIPGGAPIQSCPSPATVSTEGANQVVSGTAVDTANNTASASATVNLDLTPPVVSITSPSNGSVVGTPYVVVNGTATDPLSGVANVQCNNVPASLSGSNFSCTVLLSSVSNSINVTGTDLAGNSASANISVRVSMAAPTSLQVTPTNPNLLVGSTQSFTAVDQTGTKRPDARWSISNTGIAKFVSGQPNTLIGVAAGQATLTATIGSVSARTTVTVLSGSSLPAGTVIWAAAAIPGSTTVQIVQAVPTATGPDLYSLEAESNGSGLVRAFRADGQQLWQSATAFAPTPGMAAGDNSGGVLIGVTGGNVVDLSGQTGMQKWQFMPSSTVFTNPVVGTNGNIYLIDTVFVSSTNTYANLEVIDGNSGALKNQIKLTTGYVTNDSSCGPIITYVTPGASSQPMVGADGSVYIEHEIRQITDRCPSSGSSENDSISLLQVMPTGSTQYTSLGSFSGLGIAAHFYVNPGIQQLIPDGLGGELASWVDQSQKPPLTTIADVGPNGIVQSAFPNLQVGGSTPQFDLSGDGRAFVTDGQKVVAFTAPMLQQNWTYTIANNGSLLAATSGGGIAVNDSQLGTIQLDANGNASQPVGVNSPTDSWSGQWFNIPASGSGVESIVMPMVVDPGSIWATPTGNPSENGAAAALCDCDVQTTDPPPPPPPPPPPANCPVCKLVSPKCTIMPGSNSNAYLILVGDPGLNVVVNGVVHNHNLGDLFNLAAQTEMDALNSNGFPVVACRVTTVTDVSNALIHNGPINGGVIYYGHSGDVNGVMILAIGQDSSPGENLDASNVNGLSNAKLGANVKITLNGCNAGYSLNGQPSIAQLIANRLRRTVLASVYGVFFSQDPNEKAVRGDDLPNPPDSLPMYPIVEGAPPKPPLTSFVPH